MSSPEKLPKFHELELDHRILKAVSKLGWEQPTLIQGTAIPLLLEGKDVVVRARTGSGKTATYALPLIQKILNSKLTATEQCVSAVVLAPTKELCRQSRAVIEQLAEYCHKVVRVADISGTTSNTVTERHALAERPDIVVATPAKLLNHAKADGVVDLKKVETLVVDEADLIFAFGYEMDFKALLKHLPSIYQSVLVSATLSDDVVRMKGLCLHNPVTLKLEEPDVVSQDQLTHQRILAEENDKPVILYALLKLQLIRGKTIIFVNTIDRSYKIRLFLEQFGIRACVLNPQLPASIRINMISQFNKGTYDIIIASDQHYLERPDNGSQDKRKSTRGDFESSASRGIDFQSVNNVINFDFPLDVTSYIHRAGRTARGNNKGSVLSLVSIKESGVNDAVEKKLRITFSAKKGDTIIKNYQFKMDELESFRYRAYDAWRAASRAAVQETRLREIKTEVLNSVKLKGYFEDHQRDLNALRHDKPLRILKTPSHLSDMPEYMVPKVLKRVVVSKASGPADESSDAKRPRQTAAKAAFDRKTNDPLMVEFGNRRPAPRQKKKKPL
ncbi:GL15985 [Drosophila persimilis]|uniref:RNA helicase n=2 Tax=pseudoobscura subgroup TaxID=32358 RepID=Q29JE7_DROPS|nr:probable ATP-dependent RNA helicase DDX56 [Drosophila pseudoobscura]XP_002027657.1 probable ATP-dependent RNA helicase DDX56 [Drosophila persimilis]EDW36635.1 GL15985 [Drosophila persimilis]